MPKKASGSSKFASWSMRLSGCSYPLATNHSPSPSTTKVFGLACVLFSFLFSCSLFMLFSPWLRFCTAVRRIGWGTGIRTQIKGTADPHALHYTMPQWMGTGRGTRIRTGVQGSEAPDAIRYTIPPCCFTSDSGCTNVRRMCSFAAQAQISRTNCDDRGPASTNLVHQILVPSCISPVRIEYSNVGITDNSFGYMTVFRKIRYVVCARKPTYPRTCACHT